MFRCAAPLTPTMLHRDTAVLRVKLIAEELSELCEALGVIAEIKIGVGTDTYNYFAYGFAPPDEVEAADAVIDILYVGYGAGIAMGLPVDELFAEVHASNMSKLDTNGQPLIRADGKILKGENYFRPNLGKIIETYKKAYNKK